MEIEVIHRAPSVAAEYTQGVGIVYHHDTTILLSEAHQLRQRCNIALHGKHAVSDEQPVARSVLDFLQDFLTGFDVLVGKDLDLGARKPAAVNQGGVVELIGYDNVVLGEDSLDRSGVGNKACLKHDSSLNTLEARDLLFEHHVEGHVAPNGADTARAYAILLDGLHGLLLELGVGGKAEVVVR